MPASMAMTACAQRNRLSRAAVYYPACSEQHARDADDVADAESC